MKQRIRKRPILNESPRHLYRLAFLSPSIIVSDDIPPLLPNSTSQEQRLPSTERDESAPIGSASTPITVHYGICCSLESASAVGCICSTGFACNDILHPDCPDAAFLSRPNSTVKAFHCACRRPDHSLPCHQQKKPVTAWPSYVLPCDMWMLFLMLTAVFRGDPGYR